MPVRAGDTAEIDRQWRRGPGERTAAAAYTNTARYVARPAGPALGGYLMQTVSLSAPFVAAGAVKIVYDLALFALFRRRIQY